MLMDSLKFKQFKSPFKEQDMDLSEVIKDIEKRFKENDDKMAEFKKELDRLAEEQFRLQGEYRLVQRLHGEQDNKSEIELMEKE